MEELYQDMRGKPFEILAVSIDTRGSQDVEPFVKSLGLTFPILLDSDKKVNNMYQATGVPETFIIDKNGVVREHILGPVNWASSGSDFCSMILMSAASRRWAGIRIVRI